MNTHNKFKIELCFFFLISIFFSMSVFSQDDLFGMLREDDKEIKEE